MQIGDLVLVGLGFASPGFQLWIHYLWFTFHQKKKNDSTLWEFKKIKNLLKLNCPILHISTPTTYQPEQKKTKQLVSSWFGYIPLDVLPGIVK